MFGTKTFGTHLRHRTVIKHLVVLGIVESIPHKPLAFPYIKEIFAPCKVVHDSIEGGLFNTEPYEVGR